MLLTMLPQGEICDYGIAVLTDVDEVRLVLACHTKPKISPES